MIDTPAPSGSARARSRTSETPTKLTSIASAARAKPAPIAAAASAPVAPSGSSSWVPSGSVTVTGIAALQATRPRAIRSGQLPQRVVAERLALYLAGAEQLDQLPLGRVAVGGHVVGSHDRGDL